MDGPRAGPADTTRYVYYSNTPQAGNKRAHLKSVTAPDGSITRLLQYDAFGRPLKLQHPNGLTETRQYNTLGQLTRRKL